MLKNSLVDQMLFFLVFFYGLRSNEDALTVLKVLLAAWAVSHIVAVLDATGMFHIGDIEQRSDGRVQGAVGESNQYGAFVALSLPAIVALIDDHARHVADLLDGRIRDHGRGAGHDRIARRVRRDGIRDRVRRVAVPALHARAQDHDAGRPADWSVQCWSGIIVMSLGFGDLIYQRVMVGAGSDITATSSGRTEIWATVLEVMFGTPLTLLTGFGWEAYPTFPFRWVTHNHYLQQCFNLGLVGLICSVLLLVVPIRTANAAATYARPEVRPMLIAFGIGTIAVATAVFFVNLYSPWLYYWSMRASSCALLRTRSNRRRMRRPPVTAPAPRRAERARDAHGWTAAS